MSRQKRLDLFPSAVVLVCSGFQFSALVSIFAPNFAFKSPVLYFRFVISMSDQKTLFNIFYGIPIKRIKYADR